MLIIAATSVAKRVQIAPIELTVLARQFLGKFELSLVHDEDRGGFRSLKVDSFSPYELHWLQKVGVPHDCLPRLRLEAGDVLQKLDGIPSLFLFDLCETVRKIGLVKRSEMNRIISHGFNRRIPHSLEEQGISTETVLLMFFVYFLEVHVVHPLV